MDAEEKQEKVLSENERITLKKVIQFSDHYSVETDLGVGSYGTVKVGQHKKTGMRCAIKIIKKESVEMPVVYQQLIKNELMIREVGQHPNIIRIYELMEDTENFYIVMELVEGGNLFEKILKMKTFPERQAAHVIKQLLLALNFMHRKSIMHRDIKPENIVCEETYSDSNINIDESVDR